jgi:repressor LexA
MTLRDIAKLIGEESPQLVKHHLNQLEKKGLIRIDKVKGLIEKAQGGWVNSMLKRGARLINIPILGSANCGPAELFATSNIEGYLRVSSSLMGRNTQHRLFALKTIGPSMNRASVGDKTIEEGDYIIVDSQDTSPANGEVVVSVIDGMANVKKYFLDKENQQIVLMSESTQDFAPIHIHQDDDYWINGKVVQVIKKPKIK